MEEYKSNSHKSRETQNTDIPEKKIEKVVSGSVKTKKKTGLQKITDMFIPEDVADVKRSIFEDILVPCAKDMILDTVKTFLGISGGGSSRNRSTGISRVSYRKYYDERDKRDTSRVVNRSAYEFDDIVLENRGEAEEVLARMDETIDQYGLVSVGDLYDMVGIDGNYTDNKYGWFNIRSASVVRVRDGYMIKLPKIVPLN